MITANSDGAIRFYDWEKGEVSQTLEGHKSPMIGFVLSPSGKLLASSGIDRIVKIWDVETGKPVQELTGFSYAAPILIFSDDEKTLTTFGGINTPKLQTEKFIWNLEDGEKEQEDVLEDFGPPFAATADRTLLIGMGVERTKTSSTRFTIKTGLRKYKVVAGELGSDIFLEHGVTAQAILVFASNKAVLAINSGFVVLWGGTASTNLPSLPVSPIVMIFSPDSRMLATWQDDLKVRIFRAP